jgi:hypothetical protein
MKAKTAKFIRKTHRYLGLIIGIQFLFWTISGLYFSWTDIDVIHGDQFLKEVQENSFTGLLSPDSITKGTPIRSIALTTILDEPYYWINNDLLIHAKTGKIKSQITADDAVVIADYYLIDGLKVKEVELIEKTDMHHEFREQPLPAWAVTYDHSDNLTVYIDARKGSFQRVRHDSWRWFDFLWMFHTMDYESRDDFNNILLRIFSVSALITVLSGYLLWYISSPTIRKLKKKFRK